MGLKVSEMSARQKQVINAAAEFSISSDTLFSYAKSLSGCNERHEEYYTWCGQFLRWAAAYSSDRCKALKLKELSVADEDEFICKVIKYGMVSESKDLDGNVKTFINYCQAYLDLFDTDDQKKFAKKYCKDLGLKVKEDTADYWKQLAGNIKKYESGDFVKTRTSVSKSIQNLKEMVKSKTAEALDAVRETNPKLYTKHYIPLILEPSYEFYKGETSIITATNFAERHNTPFKITIDADNRVLVLVLQKGHYLICTRAGKVLWDQQCSPEAASAEYMKALDFANNKINEEWIKEQEANAGQYHKWEFLDLQLDYPDDMEEEEFEAVTVETETDSSESPYTLITDDKNTLVVCAHEEFFEEMQNSYPDNVHDFVCNMLGTEAEEDFDAFLKENKDKIKAVEAHIELPLPTDKYQLILAVIDTLI